MEKIKEWAKEIGIAIIIIIIFLISSIGTIGNGGGNFQEVHMRANENSHQVAKTYMSDELPNTEDYGITRYVKTFDKKDEADKTFDDIIKAINTLHSGEKLKKYGSHPEKIFLCYGNEWSIIVSKRDLKIKGGPSFSSVMIEYVETDLYDWDSLTNRIRE